MSGLGSATSGTIVDNLEEPISTTVVTLPDEGQLTMAESISVAIASDQTDIPISVSSLPLPTGAATAANQQTDALTDVELRAAPVIVDATGQGDIPITLDGEAVSISGTVTVDLGANNDVVITDLVTDDDDDVIAGSQTLPLVINENYFYSKTDANWVRAQSSTDGYLFTRPIGLYSDGGNSLTLSTQADDLSNSIDTLLTSGFNYWFDGSTWDRAKGDSTDGLLVNLGTNNDVTLATLPDTAGGDLAAINSAVSGTLTVGSHAVTNAGTFAVQENGDALTALQLIDDPVATISSTDVMRVAIFDDSDSQITSFGGGTQYTEGDTDATITGTAILWEDGSDTLATVTATNPLPVDASGTTLTVDLGAGDSAHLGLLVDAIVVLGSDTYTETTSKANLISAVRNDTLATLADTDNEFAPLQVNASGALYVVQSGTVTVTATDLDVQSGGADLATEATLSTIDTDTGNIATSTSTMAGWDNAVGDGASVSGDVAHDSADAGEPVKVGFKAESSPKGITLVADGDRTDGYADLDGIQIVKIGTSGADLISERVSNTHGTSTAFTNFDATASTYNYVTAITVYNSSATDGYVDIRDGTAGSVLYTIPLPTLGGAVLANGGSPLFRSSANTALAYDVSGALTTVYISMTGYKSKA
jgi:hypothetical protein